MTRILDQLITITSVRFTEAFDVLPRRIEFDGVSYDLTGCTAVDAEEKEIEAEADGFRFRLRPGTNTSDWRVVSITH